MKLHFFHPKTLVDNAYEISIILKAIGGLIECISGITFLFVTPIQIEHFTAAITRAELLEDPHDFIATHLFAWGSHFTHGATIFAAIYLLSHGITKLIVIAALLLQKTWAYPTAIIVFSGFAIYQIYATIAHASIGYFLLTIYDVIVIYLVWLEYKKALQSNKVDNSPQKTS